MAPAATMSSRVGTRSTMKNNESVRYKSHHSASNEAAETFGSDLKNLNAFCFEAIHYRPYWSSANKTVFADRWTIFMQGFLSHVTSLHGLKHRLILDEDDQDFGRDYLVI
jgi:hypothetical protein